MEKRHAWISVLVTVIFLVSGIVYAVKGDLLFTVIAFAVAALFGLRFLKAGRK
ncbi:antibiotic biosynthesis protein AlbB [Saccharibacillus alkalitolerans]|uniref:Antibiotic biosynthesis protein AlbB n=1 Tax=Saccharibacillus alkalitolerans TaxID=2705290 RepID=A0ABX0F345_9BACL|nr:antibiotic biosynthesis protein AlbB [Saccharibacillus alkalitolerans]NGZ75346.1 antibiotic biosynthesis protein AlbB [Saccharibacillus alkalitolerans]